MPTFVELSIGNDDQGQPKLRWVLVLQRGTKQSECIAFLVNQDLPMYGLNGEPSIMPHLMFWNTDIDAAQTPSAQAVSAAKVAASKG